MLAGVVVSIVPGKPWGFIRCGQMKSEVFFHEDELLLADLTEELIGRKVSFELRRGNRGLSAENVTVED